jgi:hypothetical protein
MAAQGAPQPRTATMLKTVAIAFVLVVVAILVFAATRPDTFRIERATRINAPPEKIFAQINDFRNWRVWSPWETKDPQMKRGYGGAAAGKGAAYEWDGNSSVGKGRMEIAESTPPRLVRIKLDFLKPMEGHNIAEFTMVPGGGATEVTWVMSGPVAYPAKIIQMFISMDRMVGGDF